MTIPDEFTFSLARLAVGELAEQEMLPTALAQACVEILGVDGASISVMSDEVRMPLGADSPTSAVAEHLQFSLGQGPCLESYRTGQVRAFTHAETVDRWPEYAQRLADETGYYSCAGVPLDLGPGLVGALDIYLTDPLGLAGTAVAEVWSVAAAVTLSLLIDLGDANPETGPDWLRNTTMSNRTNLWVAIGMLMHSTPRNATEITTLIRSYGHEHEQPFDDVTRAIVNSTLNPDAILTG